jgi:predicted lipid-binding transport protein (Tim44 family)
MLDRLRSAGRRDPEFDPPDLKRFAALHTAVQTAYGEADLEALRRLMTAETTAYFAAELARLAREDLRNVIADVELIGARLCEAWAEGEAHYASVLLRWRAIDYLVRAAAPQAAPQFVVSGDPRVPIEVEELWTFARRGGGDWLLSAIQQV